MSRLSFVLVLIAAGIGLVVGFSMGLSARESVDSAATAIQQRAAAIECAAQEVSQ
jgi:hypothetical protein